MVLKTKKEREKKQNNEQRAVAFDFAKNLFEHSFGNCFDYKT